MAIKTQFNIEDLAVTLRREAGVEFGALELPQGSLKASLLLQPQALSGALGRLGALAARLPEGRLRPGQKALFRKLSGRRFGTVLRNYAHAVGVAVAQAGAPDTWPSAERITLLADVCDRYTGISRYAAQGINRAMDQRLLLGGFSWFLLQRTTRAVVRRIEDPATPQAERTKLQNAFSGLLQRKDEILRSNEEQRALRRKKGEQAKREREAAERRTLLMDTIHAIKLKLPVDEETLAQAAEIYDELVKERAAEKESRKTAR
jgi:hypothetical protein